MRSLKSILELLNEHHQRATYGAVAGLVGGIARGLMQGRPKDQLHSWIVSQDTGLPTGYDSDKMHPKLRENAAVSRSGRELEEWLEERGAVSQ